MRGRERRIDMREAGPQKGERRVDESARGMSESGRWLGGQGVALGGVTRSTYTTLRPPAHLHGRFHHGSSLHITRRSNATL